MKEIKTQVLVAGGGPAGLGAALGASMHGADTLLVEGHGFFGGTASFCLGMPMNQMRPGGEARSRVHELLLEKLQAYGDLAVRFGEHQVWCNVEYLKVAAMDALEAAGCRFLLHLRVVDTMVENGRVTGVIVSTKDGLMRIRADAVVDGTGDADVAAFAGAETLKEAGDLAPMTLCANVGNVDVDRAIAFARDKGLVEVAEKARKRYPLIPERWGLSRFSSNSVLYINHAGTKTHGRFDGSDPEDLTKAEVLSRRQVVQMVAAMREFGGETLEQVELLGAGPQVGVRETRRLKGVYTLTEDDAKSGRRFDDVVAWRSGLLDIGFVRLEKMKIHDVPYRALLPEKVDGLLAAGRCISTTHVAAAAGKSMGNCVATGHAAGLAAALSAGRDIVPRDLEVTALQDALRKDGVDLEKGGAEQDL